MKDRFKTRIFDKTTNTMHYNDFVITSTGYVAKLERVNLAEAYNKSPELWNSENDTLFINQEDFDFDEKMIVMQCTGLKDKNGKLIYEGDIVRGKDHFDRDRKCIVRYSETYCCYFIVGDGWSDEYMFNLNDKEVIGNIYEHKELLEEYKDE